MFCAQVCEGDFVAVDVTNAMSGTGITIHWHGIYQRGTPYSDGVPQVTQCPIVETNIYRYYFYANPGTYFWHAHAGKLLHCC
ncbi:hypothetical protein PR048_026932 [Dryococelus australis]|uniref:Plastocyanin-like domain-containing protein n=1 Tax=Dryococelus australis TaxID=614101 RepID=A0ABQ9GMR4_9NEOP|nr:hypothetical protein PR048_026932 [Dryococelus australis]